jgi:hypothetical protein
MDKYILQSLYDHFGLCPEYRIVYTSDDFVEFYEHPKETYLTTKFYDFENHEYMKQLLETEYVTTKLHLHNHKVTFEDGWEISANFAVSHSIKTIFLKVQQVKF